MMIPTVHMNGTGADALSEALIEAYSKLGDAHEALRKCAPNGRDYYTQDGGALEKAAQEHRARFQRIEDSRAEIETILEGIDAQR